LITGSAIRAGESKVAATLGYSAAMPSGNLELVRRLIIAFTRADFPTALELLDARVRVYPRSEEPGVDEVYEGHDGMLEYLGNWYSQWDDYEAEPVSFREASGNRVLVEMAERGHMKRTGITLDQQFSHTFTVVADRVTEWRMYDSREQALDALGLEDGSI
jgi:ketosteroid isomerase-like protein